MSARTRTITMRAYSRPGKGAFAAEPNAAPRLLFRFRVPSEPCVDALNWAYADAAAGAVRWLEAPRRLFPGSIFVERE